MPDDPNTVQSPSAFNRLRQTMKETISREDLRTLCLEITYNFEDLPSSDITTQIDAFLLAMHNHGRLDDLLAALRKMRPRHAWPTLSDILENAYNYFSTGVGLRHPFVPALTNFFYYYLGDPKHPVSFGGRDGDLNFLEQWRQSPSSPSRLLLTAPAGRGKSALLVRWSERLKQEPDLAILFLPISLRFNTNQEKDVYSFLAMRLSHLYQATPAVTEANLRKGESRRLVTQFLGESLPNGRKLLIIIDGLDEVEATWAPLASFLPLRLPQRVRLVISARSKTGDTDGTNGWLNQLGWERLPVTTHSLQPLNRDGVADLISSGPLSAWDQQKDLVNQLYDLTKGDPLLLSLYIEKLNALPPNQPPDWSTILPGYGGYFQRWWQEQKELWGKGQPHREPFARALRTLLALAHGPLLIEDLQALLPSSMPADSGLIRDTLRRFYRLVIGNGQTQGYVLAHIKLADYFVQILSRQERADWTERFLAWGRKTIADLNSGQEKPEAVSPYIMRYYSSHLIEANGRPEDLFPLLSYSWLQVWQVQTGSPAGFLQDVTRIWSRLDQANAVAVARNAPAPYLDQTILAALSVASVKSQVDSLPVALLGHLLRAKLWTPMQVLATIRQHHDLAEEVLSLAHISPLLDNPTQQEAWRELVAMLATVPDEAQRTNLYELAARYVPEIVQVAANTLSDPLNKARVLIATAPHLPQEVQHSIRQDAMRLVYTVRVQLEKELRVDSWHLERNEQCRLLLVELAPYLPQVAISVAREGRFGWYGQDLTAVLSAAAPAATDLVLDAAQRLSNEEEQADVLAALAPHQPDSILALARKMNHAETKLTVLLATVPHLKDEKQASVWPEIVTAVLEVNDWWKRVDGLRAAAPHLPNDVLTIVSDSPNEMAKTDILIALAPYLPQEVFTTAQTLSFFAIQYEVLAALAPHLPDQVLARISEMGLGEGASAILVALAPFRPETILDLGRQLWHPAETVEVLIAVIPYLPKPKHPALWAEVIKSAQMLEQESKQVAGFAAAAAHLPEQTLLVVQQFTDPEKRASILLEIASVLPEPYHSKALEEALAATQAIGDRPLQLALQASMAEFIPEDLISWAMQCENPADTAMILEAVAEWRPQDVWHIVKEHVGQEPYLSVFLALARQLPEAILSVSEQAWTEQQRVQFLIALAPVRPEAALVKARQLWKQNAQTRVFAALLPFLPSDTQQTVAKEVWEVVEGKPPYKNEAKAYLLKMLAPYLPDAVFQAINNWENEFERIDILVALAPFLPNTILAEARQLDREAKYKTGRVSLLAALAPRIPDAVLTAAQEEPFGPVYGDLLVALAPYRPQIVLVEAEKLFYERDWVAAISAVLPYLPEAEAEHLALGLIENVSEISDPTAQTKLRLALLPYILLDERFSWLSQTWQIAEEVEVLRYRFAWDQVLDELREQLLTLPNRQLYDVWQTILTRISYRSRPEFLEEIRRFLPIIYRLGGDQAVRETWKAVQTVTTWWP